MRQELLPGYLFVMGSVFAFAGGQVLARYVVQEVAAPLVSTTFGLFFGTFFLFLFVLPRLGEEVRMIRSSRGLFFFAAAGLASGAAMTALMYGMSYSPVAVVSTVNATMPLFALLFTHLFLQHLERVTSRMWMGASLVVTGVVLVTLSQVL